MEASEDDGAGVSRLLSHHRTSSTGSLPIRRSIELSSDVPYLSRRDLIESRPGLLSTDLAEAVEATVHQEQEFEDRQRSILNTLDAQKAYLEQGDPREDSSLQLAGWMQKLSAGRKGAPRWQPRYFELYYNRLYYYKQEEQEHFDGAIPLDEIVSIRLNVKAMSKEESDKYCEEEYKEHRKGHRSHRSKKKEAAEKEPQDQPETLERVDTPQHSHKRSLKAKLLGSDFAHTETFSEPIYEFSMRSGRSHGRLYVMRCASAKERDTWMEVLWQSKLRFHAFEIRNERSIMERLVVMCCLKESEDRSFKFEIDNTLVEDLIAHFGMAVAIIFELLCRKKIVIQSNKRVVLTDERYTGVGLLDEAIDMAQMKRVKNLIKHKQPNLGDKLSRVLSKMSGIAEVKSPSMWDRAKSLFRFRWPGGPFVQQVDSNQSNIRLPPESPEVLAESWNRAIIVAAQHRLIAYEGFYDDFKKKSENRWVVVDEPFVDYHSQLLRKLWQGEFKPVDDREVAIAALAVAMLDIRRREIIDYNRVFSMEDGDIDTIVHVMKSKLSKYFRARNDEFSFAVTETIKQALERIYSLVRFTEGRASLDASGGRPSIESRERLGRRFSVDAAATRVRVDAASFVPT